MQILSQHIHFFMPHFTLSVISCLCVSLRTYCSILPHSISEKQNINLLRAKHICLRWSKLNFGSVKHICFTLQNIYVLERQNNRLTINRLAIHFPRYILFFALSYFSTVKHSLPFFCSYTLRRSCQTFHYQIMKFA